MNKEFGVITVTKNGKTTVVYDGTRDELDGMLDTIKENISDSAEIKILDKSKYESCKNNIIELDKLLA